MSIIGENEAAEPQAESEAGPLAQVVEYLDRHPGAYCPECLRKRLSLGRDMSSMKMLRAAEDAQLFQEQGTCQSCRRKRKVLRGTQPSHVG